MASFTSCACLAQKRDSGSGTDRDNQTLSLTGSTLAISNGNSVDLSAIAGTVEQADQTSITGVGTAADPFKVSDTWLNNEVKAKETQTTLDSLTLDPTTKVLTAQYTGENGLPQSKTVDLSGFVSGVAVTDLTSFTWDSTTGATVITFTKSDGTTDTVNTTIMPTFVNTDNQQLTGDTTGSVDLTLTPVIVNGVTNYTLKADVKVDGTTITIDPVTKQLKAEIPPYRTCYKIGETAATTKTTFGAYLSKAAGQARYIREFKIIKASPYTEMQTFTFATPILYWDGTNYASAQSIYDQVAATGYFSAVSNILGCPSLTHAVFIANNGNTINVVAYEKTGACNAPILAYYVAVKTSETPTGPIVGDYDSLSGTYAWTDSFNGTPFEVTRANGVTTIRENGVVVTDPTRLAQLQAVVAAGSSDSIICCPDCDTKVTAGTGITVTGTGNSDSPYVVSAIPQDSMVCYAGVENITYTNYPNQQFSRSQSTAGQPEYLASINIRRLDHTDAAVLTFTPTSIMIHNGTTYRGAADIENDLRSRGLLTAVQTIAPQIDSLAVQVTASGITVRVFSSTNTWTTRNFYFRVCSATTPTAAPSGCSLINNSFADTFTVQKPLALTVKTVDGAKSYYKSGVLVTDAAQITALQQQIETFTADNVVCCPDCNVTTTLPRTQDFTATAGQTSFTLTRTPVSGAAVAIYRDGIRLPAGSVTTSGTTATYVPASNNSEALLAGDRITIDYFA